jgi:phosphoribosylformylglycinamidine cyclo-ligase
MARDKLDYLKEIYMPGLRYADAGVDIDRQDKTTDQIKSIVRTSHGPEVLSDIGTFGGLYQPDLTNCDNAVLVPSTDSVGTKLKVAFMAGQHESVGMDIVGHCANDVLVMGARPLFFLDYIGMGIHDTDVAVSIVKGATEACREINCAVIGGELAELPDLYDPGEYDLVGTIVGLVDRKSIINGSDIRAGDRVIGLASDGLHTNGFSLARKALFDVAGYTVDSPVASWGCTVGEGLLRPHRCYVNALLPLCSTGQIKGMAHITGGGLLDNIPRILPSGCSVAIESGSWPVLPIFETIQQAGKVDQLEMYRTFNMGIGMVVIVSADQADSVENTLRESGETPYQIGHVRSGDGTVEILE